MARLTDQQVVALNPWWRSRDWQGEDRHLTRLAAAPMPAGPNPLVQIKPDVPAIHILRGPRQVGKTTAMKRFAADAIDGGAPPRNVIYLTFDLLEGGNQSDLYESVLRSKQLAGVEGSAILLLDEVTSVRRWQTGVKALWDIGEIDEDIVICTGSSAADLRADAAERLPGRRGAGRDLLLLPQSFASAARALDPNIPKSPGIDLAEMTTADGRALLADMQVHLPSLAASFERYMRFGGLPAAVAAMVRGEREPDVDLKRIAHDSIVRELARLGASVPAVHALLERTLRSLSSKTNWSRLAREMDLPLGGKSGGDGPHHATVRRYVELMADGYFICVVYYWRKDSHSNALSNDKKIYFMDPLLAGVAADFAPGLELPEAALAEMVVGTHLLRAYEPTEYIWESPAEPRRLHIWGRESGGEIDFVAGAWEERAALEVKYGRVKLSVGANVAKAHPGRPAVVASRDLLITDRPDFLVAPAPLITWALGG